MNRQVNTGSVNGFHQQLTSQVTLLERQATAPRKRDARTARTDLSLHRGGTTAKRVVNVSKVPRVSVIIPCYNSAGTIADTLTSVFSQAFVDYEVVLVNDGSADTFELEAAIAPWRDRLVYLRTENRGVASARNTGIRAARGKLIAFLDSDDIWEPDYLQVQVGKLDADPAADIVYPNAITFGDGHPPVELLQSRGEVTFESLVAGTCSVFVSALSRREALERVGLLDENLRRSEDYDLWLRCVKRGSKIIYHQQVLVRYRRNHNASLSSNEVEMHAGALRVLLKLRDTGELSPSECRVIEDAIRWREYQKLFTEGKLAFKSGDIPLAISKLKSANAWLPSRRLRLILALLSTIPYSAVKAAYEWRLSLCAGITDLRHRIGHVFTEREPMPA